MKKIFLYIFSFFIINFILLGNISFAQETCPIKETPEIINDYIKNTRIVIKNINNSLLKETPKTGIKKDLQKIGQNLLKGFNTFFSWDGYTSYFDFYVWYGFNNDISNEIWRDYGLLSNESESINKYIKSILKRGYANTDLKKDEICKGLDESICNLENDTAISILTKIVNNNENLKELYRTSLLGRWGDTDKIMFTNEDFGEKFSSYYNKTTNANCSLSNEGSFWSRAKTQMFDAAKNFKNIKTSLNSWSQAIDLAIHGNAKLEKELLVKEAQRQGLSGKQTSVLVKNLEKYNSGSVGFSQDNNFLTNSLRYLSKSVDSYRKQDPFADAIINFFVNKIKKTTDDDVVSGANNISNLELVKETENNDIENKITSNIKLLYDSSSIYSMQQDTRSEELIDLIITMYDQISDGINLLEGKIKTSEKNCKNQKSDDGGNCGGN